MKSYLNIALQGILFLFLTGFTLAGFETPCPTQDKPPQLIYSNYTQNISWSPDSSYLAFQDFNYPQKVVLSEPGWSKYDVMDSVLTQQNNWPLLPALTLNERQLFKPLTDSDGQDYWMFISPDVRYMVYTRLVDDDIFITLADRQNGQSMSTQLEALNISATDSFNVLWSANSETFVTFVTPLQMSEPEFFNRISNYANGLSGLTTQEIGFFLRINDEDFGTTDIYDVSGDGRFVLVKGYNAINGETRLILWDAMNPESPISFDPFTQPWVTDKWVFAAAFKPGDESKILVVNRDGLVEYDRQSGNTTLLRTGIIAGKTRFSPNGEWLSVKTTRELYVVDLRPTLAQGTPSACQADT
ncbi:MAG: hypothetical protein ABI690_03215 [Chloroflexota bacterium]